MAERVGVIRLKLFRLLAVVCVLGKCAHVLFFLHWSRSCDLNERVFLYLPLEMLVCVCASVSYV